DGTRDATAWAGPHDGILAIDLSEDGAPDGVIDQIKEINFALWAPGAGSDMAALEQVFDTNHDGTLDAADAQWRSFRIWQDANGDGASQAGEVHTLDELGIAYIGLTPTGPAQQLSDGSAIQGLSTFAWTDGRTGLAGDVALAFDAVPVDETWPMAAPVSTGHQIAYQWSGRDDLNGERESHILNAADRPGAPAA